MSDWRATTLGEVVNFQRGHDITRATQRDGTVPVVSSGGISSYHDTAAAKGPGVVIGRKGTLGKVFYMSEDYWPHDTTLWVQDFKGSHPRFVYYFMTQFDTTWLDAGSANPTLNRNHLHPLRVLWPSVLNQRAIAEVLGALDDKIAANTKLARTVEDLLQASYLGLIAATPSHQVEVESLIHRITPKRKVAKDELLAKGDFPVFDQSDAGFLGYLNGDGFLEASAEEPILYFGDHTCKLRIAAQRFTVGPNTVPFKGSGIPSLTLYCALNGLQSHEEYKRHWQLLMKKEVTVPDTQAATAFALCHGHLLSLLQSVSRENTCLAATRDALLPQLMSGKLWIKDAEKVLAATGV